MNRNAVVELTEEQTQDLKLFWQNFKDRLSHEDWVFIYVKLNRLKAKITKHQLYRAVMNIANSGYEGPIPEWILQILDPDIKH